MDTRVARPYERLTVSMIISISVLPRQRRDNREETRTGLACLSVCLSACYAFLTAQPNLPATSTIYIYIYIMYVCATIQVEPPPLTAAHRIATEVAGAVESIRRWVCLSVRPSVRCSLFEPDRQRETERRQADS